MGNTYTVSEWRFDDGGITSGDGGHGYYEIWIGESFISALLAAWKAKRNGCGCVKIEWR